MRQGSRDRPKQDRRTTSEPDRHRRGELRTGLPRPRDYGIGAQTRRPGLHKIRLLTNNPKVIGLDGYGLEIVERVPIEIDPHEENVHYLRAKRDKMGHLILGNDGKAKKTNE